MSISATTLGASETPDPIESWLDEATTRLRVDPEIALEVRAELKSHFDEAVNELLRAGRNREQAREEALKSLGDSKLLGQQLFRANRTRMNWRATFIWISRLALPAIAAVLIVVLAAGAFRSVEMSKEIWHSISPAKETAPNQNTFESPRDRAIASAPPDVKALFAQETVGDRRPLAKHYLDLHPDDPAAYFNYAQSVTTYAQGQMHANGQKPPNLDEALVVLTEGEKRDPCNAYYPLMQSAILLDRGADLIEPELNKDEWKPLGLTVKSEKDLEAGLAAYRRAAEKPMFHAYWSGLLSRQMGVLPDSTFSDVILRMREEISVLLPYLNDIRATSMTASAYAVEHNDPALAKNIHLLGRKQIGDSRIIIEFLVGLGITQLGNQTDYFIAQKNHDAPAANTARRQYDHWQAALTALRNSRTSEQSVAQKMHAGLIMSELLPYGFLDNQLVSAMARAEYDVADALAMAIITACLLGLAGLYAVRAFIWWRRLRANRGPMLLLSFRQITMIILIGVIAPLVLFWLWTRCTPLGEREFGLNTNWLASLITYGVLLIVILITVDVLSARAIRQRAVELGIVLPKRKLRLNWPMVLALIFAPACLAVAILLIAFSRTYGPQSDYLPMVLVILGFVPYLLVRFLRPNRNKPPQHDPYTGALARSIFVPMVISAVLVALAALPLKWSETRDVHQVVHGSESVLLGHELERTQYQQLKDEFLRSSTPS